jgi:hypothetical protein
MGEIVEDHLDDNAAGSRSVLEQEVEELERSSSRKESSHVVYYVSRW